MTGASGYIGSAVVATLVARGHHVRGLARSDAGEMRVRAAGGIPVRGDLRALPVLARAAAAGDGVIHTGATNDAERVTVDEAAVTAMVGALRGGVFVGTSGAPRARSSREPVREDDVAPLGGPLDWLAEAESRVLTASRARGIVVRPPIVYGDCGGPVQRLVEQARADGVARYVDAGLNCWSVVHVRDLARAYALLAESSLSGVFHVAEQAPLRMTDLMTAVGRRAGVPVRSWSRDQALAGHGPMAGFLANDAALDASRLRDAVRWEPTIATALRGFISSLGEAS